MRVLLVDASLATDAVVARLSAALDAPAIDRARSLADAARCLAAQPYQAVIGSVWLPDGPGLSLVASARALRPSPAVVILADRADLASVRQWLEAGVDDYLVRDELEGPRPWAVLDVARRRALAAATALHDSEERLSAIVATTIDAIITVDESQRVVVFNEAAGAIFGCKPVDALGAPLDWFVPPELRAAHRDHVTAFGRGIPSRRLMGSEARVTGLRSNGERFPCEAYISRTESAGERLYTVILRDVTERVRMEEERASLEAQLRQSQKMEAIGTLAGGIAHDFNNVLTAIIGNIVMAAEETGPAHAASANLAEAARASQRAKALVQQILTFSRRQQLTRRATALPAVVEEALHLLRATIPASVDLSTTCPSGLPQVLADPTQILQAIMSLCTNAWHALDGEAGRIAIALQDVTLGADGPAARLGIGGGRYLRLSVSDTGRGMDEATRERIFEPFFTTKGLGQGTGLGLPVVLGIVQGHGGAIEVTSAPGRGSTFDLFFPAIEQRPSSSGAARLGDGRPAGVHARRRRVLFIDDEPSIVALGLRMLERHGYAPRGFTTSSEAITALRASPGGTDVVVTDLDMPGMTGIEVARAALAIRGDLPVVLVSGLLTEEQHRRAQVAGVRATLQKPYDGNELHQVLQQVLADPLED